MSAGILGLATIGQSPRDDILPGMVPHLPPGVRIVQAGALDGLEAAAIAAMAPGPGDYVLATRLADGSSATVSRRHVLPRLAGAVAQLEASGAEIVAVLCTGAFPELTSRSLLVEPQRTFHALCAALGAGRRVGAMIPLPEQVPQAQQRWRQLGLDPLVVPASPYGPTAELAEAAGQLAAACVDFVAMDCFGYTEPMRALVRRTVRRPVLLANSCLARLLGELLAD